MRSAVKRYFSSKENIIVFILLCLAMVYGAWVRLHALSALSFWGDDGMTYLGTEAVLRYGYPLLPSGYVNFHTILSFYIRAIPAMLFGLNEFSLRLPSAIMGILTIPVTFLFAKEVLKNKVIALFSAVLITFSVWQIEFSREVRWYSEFQFFYLLSVYFFYLGFIKGKNIFKVLSTVFIILSTFINSLAVSLIFLFVALLIYRGFKGFLKRDSLTHFLIVAAAIAGQIIHRTFFWQVGISFYVSSIQSNNPILNALGKFFDTPKPFFTTTFRDMFFYMFLAFVFGAFLWFLSIFIKGLRNEDEQYLDPFGKKNWRAKFPFNVFFIYFLFFANTVFLGVGNMYSQQRYINFVFIYFVIGFCWTVSEVARLLTKPVKSRIKRPVYILIAAILFFAAASHINPMVSARIPLRSEGDGLNPDFAFSNTVSMHPDTKSAGVFIHENRSEDDLVISMELLNVYGYTKRFDHWLWSGNLISWQPYHVVDGIYYDYYFGKEVIRDITGLYDVLNANQDRNIWIHANRSKNVEGHIAGDISAFLDTIQDHILFTGKDGENQVYYLSSEEMAGQVYSVASSLNPSSEEIIRFSEMLHFDFSMQENEKFLQYGWSSIEPNGSWASSRESSLFIQFENKRDYVLSFSSKALLDPESDQTADVYLDEHLLGSITYDDMELHYNSFYIPFDIIDTGDVSRLRFVFKYNRSPAELGISAADGRNLSVFFSILKIE